MNFENILYEQKDGILLITVNRPEVRNALNRQTWLELDRAIFEAQKEDDIKVLIITGSGEKVFVSGADINALKERTMLETFVGENQMILNRLAALDKVSIAAINGHALGGGCELAMACDFRIAVESAKLGQPEINLAILPGAGGTQRLSRLVGVAKAKELILTGDLVDANEALRIGLVNRVVAQGQAVAAAVEMAQKIMKKGPLAVRLAKAVIDMGSNASLESGFLMEKLAQTVIFGTEDRTEGLSAFLEKRSPAYKNR